MGSNSNIIEIQVKVTGVPVAQSATEQIAASVDKLGESAKSAASGVEALRTPTDQLLNLLQGTESAGSGAAEAVGRLGSRSEEAAGGLEHAKSSASGLGSELGRVEKNAEFRELSLSIREGIENPLKAAGNAVQGLLLQLGPVALIGTAIAGIGASALESAEHIAKLSHEFTNLGLELGIDTTKAQEMSRVLQLVDIEPSMLLMASRTLSRTLEDNTKRGEDLRKELTGLGVTLRDIHTGAFVPFNLLLPDLLNHLSSMANVTERNRLAVEMLGRSGLQMLRLGGEYQETADMVARSGALMDASEIKTGEWFERTIKFLKLEVEGWTEAIGKKAIYYATPALSRLTDVPLPETTGKKGEEQGAAFANDFAKGIGLHLSGITTASTQLAQFITQQDRTKESLDKHTEAAKTAWEQELVVGKELANTAGMSSKVLDDERSKIEGLKAAYDRLKSASEAPKIAKASSEASIKDAEATQLALLEVQKTGAEEQYRVGVAGQAKTQESLLANATEERDIKVRSVDEQIALARRDPDKAAGAEAIIRLNSEKLAAEEAYQKQRATIVAKGEEEVHALVKKAQEEQIKLSRDAIKGIEESGKLDLEYQDKILEKHIKTTESKLAATITAEEAQKNLDIERMKTNATVMEDKLKGTKAPPSEQILQLQMQDHLIKQTIDDLTALKLAQLDANAPGYALEKQKVVGAGDEQKQRIDSSEAVEAAKISEEAALKVQEAWEKVFNKTNAAFDSFLSKIIEGHEKIAKAAEQAAKKMVVDWASALLNMGLKWIEHHVLLQAVESAWSAAKTAIHIGQAAKDTAIAASANAAQAPLRVAEVAGQAGLAAAGGFASVMLAVPFPENLALAPATAAAAAAQTLAFGASAAAEEGMLVGSSPTVTLLHPREMVLPRNLSEGVQGMIGQGGGSGDEIHAHYHAAENESKESQERGMNRLMKHASRMRREGRM